MKISLIFFFLLLSAPAFSMRNYFSETCHIDTKKDDIALYKYDYWDGYHSILNSDIPGIDNYPEVYLPGSEGSGDDKVTGKEVIVFSNVTDTNVTQTPYDDGCWKGYNMAFDRTAKIVNASSDIQKFLNFHPGDLITMKCSYEHLVIMGDACNQR